MEKFIKVSRSIATDMLREYLKLDHDHALKLDSDIVNAVDDLITDVSFSDLNEDVEVSVDILKKIVDKSLICHKWKDTIKSLIPKEPKLVPGTKVYSVESCHDFDNSKVDLIGMVVGIEDGTTIEDEAGITQDAEEYITILVLESTSEISRFKPNTVSMVYNQVLRPMDPTKTYVIGQKPRSTKIK